MFIFHMSLPQEVWSHILEIKQASFEQKVMETIQLMLVKEPTMSVWNMKDIQNHVMHDVCLYTKTPMYLNYKVNLWVCEHCNEKKCCLETPIRKKCIKQWETRIWHYERYGNRYLEKYLFKAKCLFRQQHYQLPQKVYQSRGFSWKRWL